ncbi:Transposon Ty3-I Gag-Pol polyprotein [Gossypium australe]|uniref:Transposon Ty3-I Gag-Pol polyprotein n=1 Tax=Gossypium australe TaxID=47621 RepID=A0A5B6W8B3_9ROSI|nr:Transposon Ty3-I Gag-Pol polyprotein [Gossypium australe]
MEALLKKYMAKNDVVIRSQAASLKALERKEHCKVINLKSRTQLSDVAQDAMVGEDNSNKNHVKILEPSKKYTATEKAKQKIVAGELDCQPKGRPPPPFPQQFHNSKQDGQFKRILDVLKQLHINILLVEALE